MFEGRSDICVPPVVSEQTAERVLTMRFEPVSDGWTTGRPGGGAVANMRQEK